MSDLALFTGTLTLPVSATWWAAEWGSVSITNGSPTVTGTGTAFTTAIVVGQSVSFAKQSGTVYKVKSITSDTVLTLTANYTGTTSASTSMGFSANPVFNCDGESRLRGYVFSSVAPGTIQFQLSQDGTNWDTTITLAADPSGGGSYTFDINLVGVAFFRLVVTDNGAGSTVRIQLNTIDDGSGPTLLGGNPPAPSPVSAPTTFRLGFDGIIFTTVGGNFLELSNPAASGRVIRVTLMQLCKPSVTIKWRIKKQSSLDAGGTKTTPTPVPLDSTNAATVAICKLYTDNAAAFVAGAVVGTIWSQTVTGGDIVEDDPANSPTTTQPVTLRQGESVAWTSDVALTFQGTIEFTDAAA